MSLSCFEKGQESCTCEMSEHSCFTCDEMPYHCECSPVRSVFCSGAQKYRDGSKP